MEKEIYLVFISEGGDFGNYMGYDAAFYDLKKAQAFVESQRYLVSDPTIVLHRNMRVVCRFEDGLWDWCIGYEDAKINMNDEGAL